MTTDPDQIRQEIEGTRSQLSGDVDALTDKVDPRRVAGRKMGAAKGRIAMIKERVMGAASHAGEIGQAKASSAAHQVSAAGSSAREAVGSAGHQVSAAGSSAREAVGSAGHMSMQQAQGSPLAAGLIAFGLGALVSALLRPSEQEKRAAGRVKGMAAAHSDQIKQQASSVAHQMQDNLRQPAQEAMGSVKSRATQGASAVREQGQSTAGGLRDQASGAKEEIQRR